MNTKLSFPIPKGADFDEVSRKIRGWADRKPYGVAWSIDKRGSVDVEFYLDGAAHEVLKASAGLERILTRCAPSPIEIAPPPKPRLPQSHLREALRRLEIVKEYLRQHNTGPVWSAFCDAENEIDAAINKLL